MKITIDINQLKDPLNINIISTIKKQIQDGSVLEIIEIINQQEEKLFTINNIKELKQWIQEGFPSTFKQNP